MRCCHSTNSSWACSVAGLDIELDRRERNRQPRDDAVARQGVLGDTDQPGTGNDLHGVLGQRVNLVRHRKGD